MLQTLLWSKMSCSWTCFKISLGSFGSNSCCIPFDVLQCIFNDFYRCSLLPTQEKVLRLDATSYQSSDRTVQHLCLWLQNEHERQFCEEFASHPGGTNDHDAHDCEPNNITVQNKIMAKILPVNKFTTLKFLSLLPSMNGYSFFLIIMFCSAIHACLYRSVHRHGHGHHCQSSPRAEVRIPRRAAARAHFLVINKGAGQFCLSFDTR